jgi:5-methylthioadenosine/S-adenosylhomocysteine deaminase
VPDEPTLLVVGGTVVTMNAHREVLLDAAVAVAGRDIVAIGPAEELTAAHRDAPLLDARGCVVTPGLVNAHQHLTGDSLARSCIPDLLAPGQSIFEWSVPLHGAHTSGDDRLSTLLAAVESLRYGVTTVVEAGTVAHPDVVAAAMVEAGVRGTIGVWGWDIEEGPFTAPAAEVLERQRAVVEAHPRGGLVEGWVTLVGHNLASDELLAGAAELARTLGTGMTMHLSPTSSDPDAYLARTGRRPVAHLARLGVLGHHLLLAHGVWFDDEEVELVLESATAVAYCPWAYLRLGQGVTRVGRHAELVERGGRVALGCDATNAGDLPDILRAAALAAGLARDGRVDPERFGAGTALELATIRGAEAIGLGDRIGSIEPGKRADLVVHDAKHPAWRPPGDPVLHLVWGTDGRSVRDVVVDGRVVVRSGRSTTVDEEALAAEALAARAALFERAGVTPRPVWPVLLAPSLQAH